MAFTRLFLEHDSVRDPTMPPPDPIPHHLDKCYHLLGSMVAFKSEYFTELFNYVKWSATKYYIEGYAWADLDEWTGVHISQKEIRDGRQFIMKCMVYILVECNVLIQHSIERNWVRYNHDNELSDFVFIVSRRDSGIDRTLESIEAFRYELEFKKIPDCNHHYKTKCYYLLGAMVADRCDIFMNTINYVKENAIKSSRGQMWASILESNNPYISSADIQTLVHILVKCNILIQRSGIEFLVRFNYYNEFTNYFYSIICYAFFLGQKLANQNTDEHQYIMRGVRNEIEEHLLTSKQECLEEAAQLMCDKTTFTSITDI